MSDLKRYSVKYIRDRVKSNYNKGTECEICGTSELLELHHYNTLTEMYRKWCRENKEDPADVLEHRDEFIKTHWVELVELCATLCKTHHAKLHKIYGKNPSLATAKKQPGWIQKQRDKLQSPSE